MKLKINNAIEPLTADLQRVEMKVDGAADTAETTQTQVTAIQTSLDELTQSVAALRTLVERQQPQHGDGASVHGEHDGAAAANAHAHEQQFDQGHGGGRGNGGRGNGRAGAMPVGRGFAAFGARRNFDRDDVQQVNRDDDGLGKPKFSIPRFEGSTDVEEYLTWELKIEKLWRLHEYTEDRKIKLASSEFDGYALRWWDSIVCNREEDGDPPILTWRDMKQVMRDRFIPRNYIRSLYDKLTQLKQGTKSVDDYYQEMELIM